MSTWQNMGDGLWFGQPTPAQSPAYRYMWRVRRGRVSDTRTLCLGTTHEITRDDAERLAAHARRLVQRGLDPIAERKRALTYTKQHWDTL
jgi:hypothetical protein